ncbi:uncharacterized protein LOC127876688 [Dreissena polymorpha]|uniref:Uncharacterized protein n=1 Tax=Dreissena polymorpha TaxID=45954 RepID=A0A9D4KNZ1_DREPO|nr:uncharacterized protein LOC127876688 [Dreissena polymorpha]KAH3843009.1 hypothetical protein DPMN_116515 [Dreissena polymorpha]
MGVKRRWLLIKVTGLVVVLMLVLHGPFLDSMFKFQINLFPNTLLVSHNKRENILLNGKQYPDSHSSLIRLHVAQKLHDTSADVEPCPLPYATNTLKVPDEMPTQCVRIQPDRDSCLVATEIFGILGDTHGICQQFKTGDHCHLKESLGQWNVYCNGTCNLGWNFGTIDIQTGATIWTEVANTTELQYRVLSLINKPNVGFCLIACGEQNKLPTALSDRFSYNYDTNYVPYQPQILTLPHMVPTKVKHPNQRSNTTKKGSVNFNFILLDSVSRHHFFRMLSKTLNVLNSINIFQAKHSHIFLDFELVQGVRSRTFETLQALFSGEINPYSKPFGTQAMPKEKLNIGSLLRPLKRLGYNTLWLEDLCPLWEWGISKDLLVYNKTLDFQELWKRLQREVKASGIDSLGNTLSSCKILHENGVPDPFHGPDQICYNGKHHHDYLFEYLKMYHDRMQMSSENFFTFAESNQGHEDSGIRVKYLDTTLAEHVRFALGRKSTMTIIFSDHGNAYGPYVKDTFEGRLETFHPFLFMIVPKELKHLLTESQMNALIVNQKRLISILDLHYTLTYIIHYVISMKGESYNFKVTEFNKQFNVTERGLLEEISPQRTCSNLPRIMPNLCICKGYDIAAASAGYHYVLAQYFVGQMNNEILRQRKEGQRMLGSMSAGGFGRCKRLRVSAIKNVQESKINDQRTQVKMDLYVEATGQQPSEVFFITLYRDPMSITTGPYERTTPYSPYTQCADTGVKVNLCICDKNVASEELTNSASHTIGPEKFKGRFSKPETNFKATYRYMENNPTAFSKQKSQVNLDDRSYDLNFNLRNISTFLSTYKTKALKISLHTYTLDNVDCLVMFKQFNSAGASFEVANMCDRDVAVTYVAQSRNVILMKGGEYNINLMVGDVVHVLSAVVRDNRKVWNCDVLMKVT